MRRRLGVLTVVVTIVATVSCSSAPPAPTAVPTTLPEPTASAPLDDVVTAVEVAPAGVLLSSIGQTKALTAVARNAGGQAIQAAASWTSSDPAIVSVDANGGVQAVAGVGTALITAAVGDIQSAPVYVTVAQPVTGALLIEDSQVVSGPTIVAGTSEPTADPPYEVVLRGVASPAVGTVVIGSEGRSIGGRVVSATPDGSDVRLRLVVVPPTELFTSFAFKNSIDLASGPFTVEPDLAATYDVEQSGNSFTFSPRPTSHSGEIVTASWRAPTHVLPVYTAQAQGTIALPAPPPFKECKGTIGFGGGSQLPLSLSTPPTFSLTAAGSVNFVSTAAATTVTVSATPTIKLSTELEVKSAFEAKYECKLTLVRRNFRVPGWAGLFFGGDVEFGVGFEIGGKVTLFSAKVGGSVQIKPVLQATLNCPADTDCALSGDASATTELTPTLQAPSLNQAAFEPSVNLFGFVALEAGNADIEQLQFSAIEAKAGAELAASLTLEALQIDNLDPATGRSQYGLAFKAKVGPGIKLGEFLTYLGLSKSVPLELAFRAPLGSSPTGTALADKARYLPTDPVTVEVKLDQAGTLFPSGGLYNVDRVFVLRKTGLFSTEVLADQTAADGQTDFTLNFTAQHVLDAGDLFAFVVPRLLPFDPPKFEIGAASAPVSTRSDAFAEVRVQVDPHTGRRQSRLMSDFVDFTPNPLAVGDSSSVAGARATGAYVAHVTVSQGTVEIVAQGQLDARGARTDTGGEDPQAEASASLVVHVSATGDIPYTLVATLNASGHAPACATVKMRLMGDAVAENLKAQGPSTATDPGCDSGLPGQVQVTTSGVVHASGDLEFSLDAVISVIDPGSVRTDVLHADWDIVLTLHPAVTATASATQMASRAMLTPV